MVAVAAPQAWFTYYFWLDDALAPDYARTIDIHRKPGYDPVELFLDPQLPDWLPEITLRNLRVGQAVVAIRFYRKGKASHYEVLEKKGKLHIVRQPSPWSLTATLGERLKDTIESMVA